MILFFVTEKNPNLVKNFSKLNWTSWALALCIVGLEAGNILLYTAGWDISIGQVISS
ncbi:hypothetical protein [Criibacterium bergeronii]|uniref:hypothetical protein n=1 Tax=Criibacterium bergeronii TaxID=1871336 RepID=UPI00131487B9|nr:hypothetical protein [Criibacterium bergeronii]